jgi:hypothetical protein
MLPLIFIKKKKFLKAEFSDRYKWSETLSKEGYSYCVSEKYPSEGAGRFFVYGDMVNGVIKGFVSVGLVNGKEVKNGAAAISETPQIEGAGRFVCLKLKAPHSSNADGTVGEIEITDTYGADDDVYYHPLAKFDDRGKVAQLAYHDYYYKAIRPVPLLTWRHMVLAS